KCGFDYLHTEPLITEFTHGSAIQAVRWLNETVNIIYNKYKNKQVFSGCHITAGRYTYEYPDPVTGKPPLNFYFLPHYADKRLGIYPHTVCLELIQLLTPVGSTLFFDRPCTNIRKRKFHKDIQIHDA